VEIDTGQIKLPMFQREFVWEKEQTAKLIDSILKGFPIGTFIFWKPRRNCVVTRKSGITSCLKHRKAITSNTSWTVSNASHRSMPSARAFASPRTAWRLITKTSSSIWITARPLMSKSALQSGKKATLHFRPPRAYQRRNRSGG